MTQIDKLDSAQLFELHQEFKNSKPFNHIVIDNFLNQDVAEKIANEFPPFEDNFWYEYNNQIEIKKASNNWNLFPEMTYQFFTHVLSPIFSSKIEIILNGESKKELIPDIGLHGGGFHTHKNGGRLNPHLDYSLHPKLKKERVVNLILYINPLWKAEYGGQFGLWEHNSEKNEPGNISKKIDCLFNRAVIFDTTQNSWHGITDEITSPEGITRNSLATYYLREPVLDASTRMKAMFAPTKNQLGDKNIEKLIQDRLSIDNFYKVYKK